MLAQLERRAGSSNSEHDSIGGERGSESRPRRLTLWSEWRVRYVKVRGGVSNELSRSGHLLLGLKPVSFNRGSNTCGAILRTFSGAPVSLIAQYTECAVVRCVRWCEIEGPQSAPPVLPVLPVLRVNAEAQRA